MAYETYRLSIRCYRVLYIFRRQGAVFVFEELGELLGRHTYLVGYFAHCEVCICKMGSTIFVALSMSLPSSWLTMTSEVFMSG